MNVVSTVGLSLGRHCLGVLFATSDELRRTQTRLITELRLSEQDRASAARRARQLSRLVKLSTNYRDLTIDALRQAAEYQVQLARLHQQEKALKGELDTEKHNFTMQCVNIEALRKELATLKKLLFEEQSRATEATQEIARITKQRDDFVSQLSEKDLLYESLQKTLNNTLEHSKKLEEALQRQASDIAHYQDELRHFDQGVLLPSGKRILGYAPSDEGFPQAKRNGRTPRQQLGI